MPESSTLTLRLDSDLKDRLDGLADLTKRSKSALAAEAIEQFVTVNEKQIDGIKAAMSAMDLGVGVSHQEVSEWIDSWDHEQELPVPGTS